MTWIRRVYLYSFAAIGLTLTLYGGIAIFQVSLKATILPDAWRAKSEYSYLLRQKERDNSPEAKKAREEELGLQRKADGQKALSWAIPFLVFGIPMWQYHWKAVVREDRAS